MGACIYCGGKAGFFRKSHKECEKKNQEGLRAMRQAAESATRADEIPEGLKSHLESLADEHFVPQSEIPNILISAWELAVERALDDGLLTEAEEQVLEKYQKHFNLSQASLDKTGAYTKLVKAAVLRDIMNGTVPERLSVTGNLPFNFQKSETLVWVFQNVHFYEEKTTRTYVGGHSGFSIRIAKGVYYRTGAFKGRPVETSQMMHKDIGLLGITTKHVYFAGAQKSFRTRFDKIVTFAPYHDGIGIQKDGVRAKPQVFKTGDGWFVYNLVMNLSQM